MSNDFKLFKDEEALESNKADNLIKVEDFDTDNLKKNEEDMTNLARKYQLIGTSGFTTSCAILKIAVSHWDKSFPQLVYVGIRILGICLISFIYMKIKGERVESLFNVKNKKWMLIRAVSWLLSFSLYSISVTYLKQGTASLLVMLSPILQNIVYSYIFNTPHDKRYFYTCFISLIGVYLVFYDNSSSTVALNDESNPSNTEIYDSAGLVVKTPQEIMIGIICGIINAFAIAFMYSSVKSLNEEYDSNNINYISSFWTGIIALILSCIITPGDVHFYFNPMLVFYCLIIAVFSFIGFHFVNQAIITADISKSSYIMYLQLPTLAIFGMILYDERYTILEYFGFIVILAASIYTSRYIK